MRGRADFEQGIERPPGKAVIPWTCSCPPQFVAAFAVRSTAVDLMLHIARHGFCFAFEPGEVS